GRTCAGVDARMTAGLETGATFWPTQCFGQQKILTLAGGFGVGIGVAIDSVSGVEAGEVLLDGEREGAGAVRNIAIDADILAIGPRLRDARGHNHSHFIERVRHGNGTRSRGVLKRVSKVNAGCEVNGFYDAASGDELLHLRGAHAKSQRISLDA